MKIKAILFAFALSGVSVFGQGVVTFQNSNVAGTSIYLSPGVLLPTAGQTAFSFYFTYGSSLQYTSQTYFNHETQAGRITTTGTAHFSIPNAPGGVATSFQMYMFQSSYGSFNNAVFGGGIWYISNVITTTPSTAPTPGVPLFGLTPGTTFQGFTIAPEPSTYVMGILGAGSLLLFRRKRK